jgi:hypothetical protein
MLYLDTSIIVALHVHEPHTVRVVTWLKMRDPADLSISPWAAVEFASALALKVRTGQIDEGERTIAQASFRELLLPSLEVLAIESPDYHRATTMVEVDRHGLRAGDALHLAIAERHRRTVLTLDQGMATSGRALGLRIATP